MAPPKIIQGAGGFERRPFCSTRIQKDRPASAQGPLRAVELSFTRFATSGTAGPNARPEEERLEDMANMAYTSYLQQHLLNKISRDMAELQCRAQATKCTESSLDTEVIEGFTNVKNDLPHFRLILTVQYLLKAKLFVEIYKDLEKVFEGKNWGALEEIQTALVSKFNTIALKDVEWEGSPRKGVRGMDFNELIRRIKEHFAPVERPTEVKSFLCVFLEALEKLLKGSAEIEKNRLLAEEVNDAVVEVSSLIISSNVWMDEQRD